MKRVELPVRFAAQPIIYSKMTPALSSLLGDAHMHDADGDGLGPTDYWALAFPCGLEVLVERYIVTGGVVVTADEPEIAHVARHLCFDAGGFESVLADGPVRNNHARWNELRCARLWRQDDNGIKFDVTGLTTLRDARCLLARLESAAHKQVYWVEEGASDQSE